MNGLNLNSHPYWRASSRFENGFYRTKPPQEKSEAPRSTGSKLSSTKRLKSENQVKIRPDLKTNEFFKEFNNAQSNKELANLFERLDDQLPLINPLKNQSQTDSPELRFYNYLKTPSGMLNLENKISKNIKDELEKINNVNLMDLLIPEKLISNFEENIAKLFLSLASLNLKQSAQKLLEHYNNELDTPRAAKKLGKTNGDSQSFRQVYPFGSFIEQIGLLVTIHPSNKEPLELSQAMKDSHNLWDDSEPEVFEHYHLGNLLEMYGPSGLPRENPSPETLAIARTINHLIEREDFKNTDSLKILDAYLSATTKDFVPEANKLLKKSFSFYFENFNNVDLHEDLMNLTNLFQVAASKGIIPTDQQKALGEDFLNIFKDLRSQNPDSLKQSLSFMFSSTILNKIDEKKYSEFISENIDPINELISENPILVINNLCLDKVNSDLKIDLQAQILAAIRLQGYQLPKNTDKTEISPNDKFSRVVLAAFDKGFINDEQLERFLPDHLGVRSRIEQVDSLNLLASQTISATEHEEKAGIDDLIYEIIEQASEESDQFDPYDQAHLLELNLEIISTLQDLRQEDPTHFRSLITQSLDPDRLTLPDELENEAINPFNHLLLTKAFCDPTKKLYQDHDSAEHTLTEKSFAKTNQYIETAFNIYKSEKNNRPKIEQETPFIENEEHKLNEELISSLIDKSFNDLDAHHQSIESITDVYFNLLDNHYFKAANHLLEGEIMKAFKPNDELEAKSDEFKQHLLKIYNFARENLIMNDVTASYPTLKALLDNFPPKEGSN